MTPEEQNIAIAEHGERFEKRLVTNEKSGCLEWSGGLNGSGYGMFYFGQERVFAHRFSWLMWRGDIPVGRFVLHKCDNRKCVNPAHLFIGSQKDNVSDMDTKRRRNASCGAVKLTTESINAIRNSALSQCQLARDYGVCQATIHKIKTGKNVLWILQKLTS